MDSTCRLSGAERRFASRAATSAKNLGKYRKRGTLSYPIALREVHTRKVFYQASEYTLNMFSLRVSNSLGSRRGWFIARRD